MSSAVDTNDSFVVATQDKQSQDGDLVNGNIESVLREDDATTFVKNGRIIKKAKRFGKSLAQIKGRRSSEENKLENCDGNIEATAIRGAPSLSKNSRKSRSATGRGLPKKGGAGGKGVWGAPGSELTGSDAVSDTHDPNYDSDSQGEYVVQKITPELTEAELVTTVTPILQEYLEHGDTNEVADLLNDLNIGSNKHRKYEITFSQLKQCIQAEYMDLLNDLNIGSNKHRIMEMAVSLALERHDPQRELTSRLISDLYGQLLNRDEMMEGFHGLLANLPDLTLDTPDAPSLLAMFLARAIADDCLPPKFLTSYKGHVESEQTSAALEKASTMLGMNHGMARLDNVWGEGGGNRPVKYLTRRMRLLLEEFINSGDVTEAIRCLKELDVPHFHHELVYETVVMAIEKSKGRVIDLMVSLLRTLSTTNIVTPDEFAKGMKRVFDDMPDICLDVPAAYTLLEQLGGQLYQQGCLSDAIYKEMPARGRKRFVSEGDGGKVKT